MSHRRYRLWNAAMPTTAPIAPVATGTATKTMLLAKFTQDVSIFAWGYAFDAVPSALIKPELLTTGLVAPTGFTAYNAADIVKWDEALALAAPITLASSGFAPAGTLTEGAITATRLLDGTPAWEQKYYQQFALDREPMCPATDYLRIRMTTAVTIGCVCFVDFEV